MVEERATEPDPSLRQRADTRGSGGPVRGGRDAGGPRVAPQDRHRADAPGAGACLPATATVENAKAVIVIRFPTLAEARRCGPTPWGDDGDQLRAGAVEAAHGAISSSRTPSRGRADGMSGPTVDEVGSLSRSCSAGCSAYRLYVAKSPEYPKGYSSTSRARTAGTSWAKGLEYTVTLPTQGRRRAARTFPLVQSPADAGRGRREPERLAVHLPVRWRSEAVRDAVRAFMDVVRQHAPPACVPQVDLHDRRGRVVRPLRADPVAPAGPRADV
jgi:hypothetical protein